MKRIIAIFLLSVTGLFLFGCQDATNTDNGNSGAKEEEGNNEEKKQDGEVSELDIFDFAYIKMAPETTEEQDIQDIIKLYLEESSMSETTNIAIDIGNNEIYINPSLGSRGLRFSDEIIKADDIHHALTILEDYQIQEWKEDYTFENPDSYQDGFGWSLWLQYKDGSVKKHSGEGTSKEEITPDNFESFVSELKSFVDEKLNEQK